ncbi:VENN motif pre-toxin domain-containing protein [Siccibacter colletis]|uniref:VENN motif pre-toxin domain-containing protein n=1 Tax=Siccibacter colletis TaxID=1505757 RepID=UPI00221E520B|nr:VENN motif pre-toxin domain-containing protein [Siccibacter colletis]
MGEHTWLNGAVIGSTASADKNRLDTGTLGFSDIHNQADYKVEHQSIGLSTGGSIGSQFAGNLANTMLAGVNEEGHDSGTTRAAVSDGTLVVRDQDKQGQDVAQLSRDVEHANGSISQIFDKEKEQQRIQQAQLVGEMVSQATDIVRSEVAIHATEAAKAKLATASKDDLDKARQDILDKNPKANPDAKDIASQAYQNYYDAEVKASGFGVGGTYSRVMDTAGAVIKGLAGNDLGAALAGGAAPWIADFIGHKSGLDNAGKIAAHAVVNAALAAAQGQNAAAGAAGAITGELTGMIAEEMYGKKAGALTESEKETVSALATLASGLAGGLVGDSTQSAAYAAQTGKTTVENNLLGDKSAARLLELEDKLKKGDKSQKVAEEYISLVNFDERSDSLLKKFNKEPQNLTAPEKRDLYRYLAVVASEMEQKLGADVTQQTIMNYLSGQQYMMRVPDKEALRAAESAINTWGYHNSNASIGDPVLMFGTGPLGDVVKGGAAVNAAIGVSINTINQLNGDKPFSYVDAVIAGGTAALTKGKGIKESYMINIGGAAIGSGLKGENPSASMFGAMVGTYIGGKVELKSTKFLTPFINKPNAEMGSAVIGAYASEKSSGMATDLTEK